MRGIYTVHGRLVKQPDPDWYREQTERLFPPRLERRDGVIWVTTAEGWLLGFSGAVAALEVYAEAERRYQEYVA